jgi:hypothetical protein
MKRSEIGEGRFADFEYGFQPPEGYHVLERVGSLPASLEFLMITLFS